jgi:transcriptional regulator with XRE-family HTH domain
MSEGQTEQLARVLKILLRFSKIQNQEIEKKLGFSGGYVSRLLSGKIDLKISHVLDLAAILDMEPHELFAIAFPQARSGPSLGLQHIQKVLPHLVPASLAPAPQAPRPDLAEVHDKLEAGFHELLRNVFAEVRESSGRLGSP